MELVVMWAKDGRGGSFLVMLRRWGERGVYDNVNEFHSHGGHLTLVILTT